MERRGIGIYLEKMVFPLRFLLAGARLSGCSMVRRCNVLSVFLGLSGIAYAEGSIADK